MRLSVALRIWNIWKCKGLVFAQFWSNIHQSSSNWSYTTQIFNEKYRHLIFVKNLGDLGKKREGGVCQGWNFWWWHMRSLWEKNLKIAFLTVAPFIVKFRFEKYRYLLTHLLCLQIFEVLLSDKHSTGPRNGRLVLLPVACLVWWYSFRPQIYDESETDQILNAKYYVWKNYTLGKWGLREAFNQNSLMQLFNGDRRIVQWYSYSAISSVCYGISDMSHGHNSTVFRVLFPKN